MRTHRSPSAVSTDLGVYTLRMPDVFADWSFEAEGRDDGWYFLARHRKDEEDGAHWGPYIDEHDAFDQGYCDSQAWVEELPRTQSQMRSSRH